MPGTTAMRRFGMYATDAAAWRFTMSSATATTAVRMLECLRLLRVMLLEGLHLLRVLTL